MTREKTRNLTAIAALAVVATLTGCEDKPRCPTEDSCTVDYRDGEWHIEKDRP